MSKFILNTENVSALPNPSVGEYYLAVDTDGMLKLKRQTDTIILGLTGSVYLSTHQVTFNEFDTYIGSSALNVGDVYIITDFKTRHYIQYTDVTGDGTGGSETVNVGTGEQICVLATSTNTYDNRVRSTSYPDDFIIWDHSVGDGVSDHAGGVSSTGHISYRKSVNGNERDYDFREVVFRRWNDGFGNYNIIRKIDAPVPGDYIDLLPHDENYHYNNKVGSSFTQSGSIYYMDNVVFATPSYAAYNNIKKGSGAHISSSTFSNNNIGEVYITNFIGDITTNNQITSISGATFTHTTNNNIGIISNSDLGTLSNNKVNEISDSAIDSMSGNTLDKISYQISTTIDNNKGGVIESNTSNVISRNTITEISGNTASSIICNISCQIKTNDISGDITYNDINNIESNVLVGDISYNNGFEILSNFGTGSIIDNNTKSITSNTIGGDINSNTSRLIATNSTATMSNNNVDEISLNTEGIITNNKGIIISQNDVDLINSNISDIILSNATASNISKNISYEISYNTGDLINNKVLDIKYNSGIVNNNIGSTISGNTSMITNNKVDRIETNTTGDINNNIGETILVNTGKSGNGVLSFNNVSNIENNSLVATISNNRGKSIRLNSGQSIENNEVTEILSNSNYYIQNNKSELIQSNLDTALNGGVIESNHVSNITSNSNFAEIKYNSGNEISSNLWSAHIRSGATAGFSFTTPTLSIGDYAIVNMNGNTFSVISTTTSATGFIDEIYAAYPQFGFSGTYSGVDFIATEPTSTVIYEGAPFSIEMVGTMSSAINTSYGGSGLNDILIDSSAYATTSQVHYLVFIDSTGVSNDTFGWFDDQGNSASNVLVTGGSYSNLSYGVQVAFVNSFGHNVSDNWDFDISSSVSALGVTYTPTFTGETIDNISRVSYNNVTKISGNYYSLITNNTGNSISGNTASGSHLSNNTTGDLINGTVSFSVSETSKGDELLGVDNDGVNVKMSTATSFDGSVMVDSDGRFAMSEHINEVIETTNYVINVSESMEEYYGASHSSALTITLPETLELNDGKKIIIKDQSGDASSNNITINSWTGSLIDGATNSTIVTNYGVTNFRKVGDNWWVI
jgi:hypothetical protein